MTAAQSKISLPSYPVSAPDLVESHRPLLFVGRTLRVKGLPLYLQGSPRPSGNCGVLISVNSVGSRPGRRR